MAQMLAGAVGVARQMHQVLRVEKLQVGQQIHLLRRPQGFFCDVGHMASFLLSVYWLLILRKCGMIDSAKLGFA